jgi:hypothetical protein
VIRIHRLQADGGARAPPFVFAPVDDRDVRAANDLA